MNVSPNAELLDLFRSSGGGNKPAHGAYKVCYGQDEAECRKMAHRLWPNDALPGELGMILPTPAHFEQAAELVTEEMVAEVIPCGPDPEPHRETIRQYAEAGYDEVYVQQVGPNQKEFFDLYEKEILPEFR
jgi:G6PDH family F420-dependent oxidoreductase